ncbi:uncharacterized protein BDV14DRAFT_205340 [Aspergillus stella-maris]|uniref:uncharacterized protein n=1 Tax=Aspergillus stella-maris TaxID=1810926 RepID=UPI003CCDB1DF
MDSNVNTQKDLEGGPKTIESSGQRAPERRPGESTVIDEVQLRNDEHVLAIFRRHLARGERSERVEDTEFSKEVLDFWQDS